MVYLNKEIISMKGISHSFGVTERK